MQNGKSNLGEANRIRSNHMVEPSKCYQYTRMRSKFKSIRQCRFRTLISFDRMQYIKEPTSTSVPSTPTCDTSQHPRTPNPNSVSRRISLSNHSSLPDSSFDTSNSFIRRIHSPHQTTDARNGTPQKILLRTTPTTARHDFITPTKQTIPFDRSTGSTSSYQHTPGSAHKSYDRSNTSRKSGSTPISLIDFMHTPASTPHRKSKPKKQDPSPSQLAFDSEFPKISSPHQQVASSTPTHSPQTNSIKPKRRVVPIKLVDTSSASAFSSPAFQTDNNLIGIGDEFEGLSISRDMLRTHKALIAQDFERNEVESDKLMVPRNPPATTPNVDSFVVDLSKATDKSKLDQMAAIYGALLNLNLTTNILNEISYVLNMLNADFARCKVDASTETNEPWSNMFANGQNCVYFSIAVLRSQKQVLLMLDVTTLKVLLQTERLVKCDASMYELLSSAHDERIRRNSANQTDNRQLDKSLNVSYQQDIDTKQNFPTTREFSAFNKQRDMFYQILRIWQSSHFVPSWNFGAELGVKIRHLLQVMDHPINMLHLAKLFTSQLMLSCTFDDAEPDLQLELPKADPSRLSKLQQRLYAPSNFSTDFTFPGQQAFFKEFLAWAEHNPAFVEQLKTTLISELLELNDSTYEVLNVRADTVVDLEQFDQSKEYVVRSETIVKMRVLAKFLGLMVSKTHQYEGVRCVDVDMRQIVLRNKINPEFNVKAILLKSILDQKLLIVIPWLVQFMSMLDFVTLRLDYYREVFELLFEIYILSSEKASIPITATSLFIVKSCLGWLFEQPDVPDEYFRYRQNRRPSVFLNNLAESSNHLQYTQILVPRSMLNHFVGTDLWVANYEHDAVKQELRCTLRQTGLVGVDGGAVRSALVRSRSSNASTPDEPMERILTAACPFLADFRVSIMPQKHSKTVSRTGRFRHITTKTAEPAQVSAPLPPKCTQTSLSEAFLHSQTLSVRRTVDFVIERTISAVIKDFQVEHLLPLKSTTMDAVQLLVVDSLATAAEKLLDLFTKAKDQLMDLWRTLLPGMIRHRVEQSFDALLPHETLDAVKLVCIRMSIQKCVIKTNEWQAVNLTGIDIFSKDIQADAAKLIKGSFTKPIVGPTIIISSNDFSPAKVFSRLQIELYLVTSQPALVLAPNIIEVLLNIRSCVCTHTLPDSMNRTAGFMTLQLALLVIARRSDLFTKHMITAFMDLWACHPIRPFSTPSVPDEAADPHHRAVDTGVNRRKHAYIFQDVLSIPGLANMIEADDHQSFDAMERFLVELLHAKLLTIEHINQQSVRLLRVEWPVSVLNRVSTMLLNIVEHPKLRASHSKESVMFLEMLSDWSRDLEMF